MELVHVVIRQLQFSCSIILAVVIAENHTLYCHQDYGQLFALNHFTPIAIHQNLRSGKAMPCPYKRHLYDYISETVFNPT